MAVADKKRYSSSIVTIDPSSLISYSYSKNEIKLNRLEKSDKNAFFISYLKTRDVISTSIEISRSVPDSDIKDSIEIKVYDELALDPAINYEISYIETATRDSKNRTFNVFIIDTSIIYTKLTPIKEKTRYIDHVTIAPFLIKSLYDKSFVEAEGTHAFVYFQKNDAFLSIYKNGEYVYFKSLHFSLGEMCEKFCELIGERIDDERFYRLITSSENLSSSHQEALDQLYNEIFLYISDVLAFAKRSYGIDYVDSIYVGSEAGILTNIDSFSQSHIELSPKDFNFSIAINQKEWYIDQIHILMMLCAQAYMEESDDNFNFSIYKRPPPLMQRPSGKLLMTIAASVVISAAYPTYQYAMHSILSLKIAKQTEEFNTIYKQTSDIRQQLQTLRTEKDAVSAFNKVETEKLNFRKQLLQEIYNKKVSYTMKASALLDIFRLSNKNNCKVATANYKQNKFSLLVHNNSEKKITEFIQDLTSLGKYKINTEKIQKDEKLKLYTSTISIGVSNE